MTENQNIDERLACIEESLGVLKKIRKENFDSKLKKLIIEIMDEMHGPSKEIDNHSI